VPDGFVRANVLGRADCWVPLRRNLPELIRFFATHLRLRFAPMLDVIFVALGLGFFVAAGLYLYSCDRL
jgi:hypothetical protein